MLTLFVHRSFLCSFVNFKWWILWWGFRRETVFVQVYFHSKTLYHKARVYQVFLEGSLWISCSHYPVSCSGTWDFSWFSRSSYNFHCSCWLFLNYILSDWNPLVFPDSDCEQSMSVFSKWGGACNKFCRVPKPLHTQLFCFLKEQMMEIRPFFYTLCHLMHFEDSSVFPWLLYVQ